jgi:hypothetical protein
VQGGKYPPAEPGALDQEPAQSGCCSETRDAGRPFTSKAHSIETICLGSTCTHGSQRVRLWFASTSLRGRAWHHMISLGPAHSWKCQTATATPGRAGGTPLIVDAAFSHNNKKCMAPTPMKLWVKVVGSYL